MEVGGSMIKVVLNKSRITEIIQTDRFLRAIQLMRIVKTISYNQRLIIKLIEDNEDINLRLFLIYHQSAALFEGLKKFFRLDKHFKLLPSYVSNEEEIQNLRLECQNSDSFINSVARPIRDKIVSHFDEEVIWEVVKEFVEYNREKGEDIVLLSGKTDSRRNINFDFADNMDFNYSLNLIRNDQMNDKQKADFLWNEINQRAIRFVIILENIIGDILIDYSKKKII
jgi:hypothetical protein